MKNSFFLLAVLLLSAPARAIELSLEENRGERGSVGYVDMQRLFTASPDAQRAKESFEDLVRQAEERVNLRKAELLKLRQALDAARVERDALSLSMTAAAAAPVPAPVPAPPVPAPAVSVSTPAVSVSTPPAPSPVVPRIPAPAASVSTALVSTAPASSPVVPRIPAPAPPESGAAIPFASSPAPAAVSTAAAPAAHAKELALPGMSMSEAAITSPPASVSTSSTVSTPAAAVSTGAPNAVAAAVPATVAVSTKAAQQAAAPVVSTAAVAAAAGMFPMPAAAPAVPQAPAGPTPVQRLLEIDAKIIGTQADIAHKESDLAHEHDDADRGLLDVESRKTDQVLARLYRAVSEVARREGVSVVIDKTTILYGHQAVDLTDKVLKYLRETPAVPAAP